MRKKIEVEEIKNYFEMIPEYGKQKQKLDALKKDVEKLNKLLKDVMVKNNLTEADYDGWQATYIVQKRESFNEDALIELLTDALEPEYLESLGIIKMKPVIDYDNLENAIYNDKLSKALLIDMDKTKTVKEVPTLRIKKLK